MGLFNDDIARDMAVPEYAAARLEAKIDLFCARVFGVKWQLSGYGIDLIEGSYSSTVGGATETTGVSVNPEDVVAAPFIAEEGATRLATGLAD